MDSASFPRFIPPEPRSLEECGLSLGFLADLVLKVMYTRGFLMGHEIADALKLPFANIIDRALDYLRREHLSEVRGSSGLGESSYQYVISEEGRARARELMDQCQYAGAAPVPLDVYTRAVLTQSLKGQTITRDIMQRCLSHLVLSEHMFDQLGPAINSGRSIFLWGNPGNGKTAIAEGIGAMLPGMLFIPYAVNIDGHIIKVYDALHHRAVTDKDIGDGAVPGLRRGERYDRRWVVIQRPMIAAGGELLLESLDLVYDTTTKYYEAPYQMKANGGMFLIDDFGRQQVRPRDLLNRWIVPLEKRVDYLTLHTGRKIEIPFDVLIVFSTNLAPRDLVDEAFLRRIRHKIEIGDPTFEEYREIFKRVAEAKKMQYDDRALAYLMQDFYIKSRRRLRAVHPRDLIEQMVDIARYLNVPMVVTKDLI